MARYIWPAVAGTLTFAGEMIFGRRRGILIGVICAIAVLILSRFRRRRFYHCAWCAGIIWPWQTWVCRIREDPYPNAYYHNTMKRDCFARFNAPIDPESIVSE